MLSNPLGCSANTELYDERVFERKRSTVSDWVGNVIASRIGPGDGNGNPLQYSCLENSLDRGASSL